MPDGFEYFPYSFKAWQSPSNPSKQDRFSQYCVWIPVYSGLHTVCLASEFTNNPRVRNCCGCSLGRHCEEQEGACRHSLWCACAQCCPLTASAHSGHCWQDSANIHGNRGRGGKWHTYPGLTEQDWHIPKAPFGSLTPLGQIMKLEEEPKLYRTNKSINIKGKK